MTDAASFAALVARVERLDQAGADVIATLGGAEAFLQTMAALMEKETLGVFDLLPSTDALRLPEEHDARSTCGHYRWFFHFHSKTEKADRLAGHFHLFVAPSFFEAPRTVGLSHLIAVELDSTGDLQGFFVPNRWVTDEHMRPACALVDALPGFCGTEKTPALIVSYWLDALLQLFHTEIVTLLTERDRFLTQMNDTARAHYLENQTFDRICEWRL